MFLEISQYSKENTCARYSCFPVNFAKLSRTPFFTEQLRWLLLSVCFYWEVFKNWSGLWFLIFLSGKSHSSSRSSPIFSCSFFEVFLSKNIPKRSSCELQTFNHSAISIRNSFIWRFELCQCFFCNYFNIRLSFSSSVNL